MNYKNITKLSMLALTAGCMAFASCNKEDETIFINNATVDTVKAAQSAVKYQDVTNLVQVGADGMITGDEESHIYLLTGQSKQIFSSEYKRIYSYVPEVVTVDNNGVVTAVAAGEAWIDYFFGNEARGVYVKVLDPESDYEEIGGFYQPIYLYNFSTDVISSPLKGSGMEYHFNFGQPRFSLFVPEGKSFQEAELLWSNKGWDLNNLTITSKSDGVYRIDIEATYHGAKKVFHYTYDMNENY